MIGMNGEPVEPWGYPGDIVSEGYRGYEPDIIAFDEASQPPRFWVRAMAPGRVDEPDVRIIPQQPQDQGVADVMSRMAQEVMQATHIPDYLLYDGISYRTMREMREITVRPRQAGRTQDTIEKLTRLVNDKDRELRNLRQENKELRRQLEETRRAAGYSDDNAPALGGRRASASTQEGAADG